MNLFKVTYKNSTIFMIAKTHGVVVVNLVTIYGFSKEELQEVRIDLHKSSKQISVAGAL